MVRLLLLAIIIAAGLFLGPILTDQKGYVLIAVDDWTIETSIVVLVMVIIVFYACLQLAEWAVINTVSLWGRTRHWFGWRRHQLAQEKTLSSLLDLAGGRFEMAEKDSSRYAKLSDQPMLNYLTAANAAQKLGKIAQRDKYLESATLLDSEDSALVATRLRMLIDDSDAIAATAWLATLSAPVLNKPEILALALPVYQQAKQWSLVLPSATKLYKAKLITSEQFDKITWQCHQALLEEAAEIGRVELHDYYNALSRKLRNNIDIFTHYANLVINAGGFNEIETSFFKLLRKDVNFNLIPLLVKANDSKSNSDKLLSLEQKFTKYAVFHSTLADLFADLRQWQEAKSRYQQALELEPSASLYHKLALAQQELGEKNGALESFNKALAY